MMPDGANDTQARIMLDNIAQAAASAAILKYKAHKLDGSGEAAIPPLIKWLVGAIGAFGSTALIGLGIWLVSSVSTMRETLARMDERQVNSAASLAERFEKIDERLSRLESSSEAAR